MTIRDELEEMAKVAEMEGKWLETKYQFIRFTPKEARLAWDEGRFIWGPCNWNMINPPKAKDPFEEAAKAINEATKYNEELKKRLK